MTSASGRAVRTARGVSVGVETAEGLSSQVEGREQFVFAGVAAPSGTQSRAPIQGCLLAPSRFGLCIPTFSYAQNAQR